MSTEPKMTPWFVNGEKPARKGVYNVSCRKRKQSGKFYGYFDGKKWLFGMHNTPERALKFAINIESDMIPDGSWRGLAIKP